MEDIEFKIRGKVEDWRIQRNASYLVHCSLVKHPINIYEWMPLPLDNELKDAERVEQEEMNDENKIIYMEAYANNYFNRPIEDFGR